MNEILEPILTLLENPFTDFFQYIGFNTVVAKALSAALIALMIWLIIKFLKNLQQWLKDIKTARELVHFRYDYRDVKQKRDLFIPTQGQSHSPTYEEEPKQGIKFIPKVPLIPFFINTAFNEKKESDKFYLVLGDSGMGKTTFMLNLYLKYHSLFNWRRKFKMKLFPFGDKDILKWIKDIKPDEARDTILLLDAFDECKALLPPEKPDGLTDDERFQKVLDEVVECVKDFREVVITSRTQYFPGQEDKPYELKIPRYGREGFHTLAKLYISPFDDKEIKRYLNKKYGVLKLWNHKKKQTAIAVVNRSPKLMVRPMLLSYIDYLVESNQVFENTWQIYETLIAKWIEREAAKRKHKISNREKFKQDLHKYSQLVAVEIYRRRQETTALHLNKQVAVEIARNNNLNLRDYEITGQSLLTRDAEQNWKFAHKSILEYFIAKEALESFKFWKETDFTGMDMAREFYYEKIPEFVLIKGGTFLMGSPDNEVDRREDENQHQVKVSDFYMSKYPITVAQFETFILESHYQTEADKGGGSYIFSGRKWKMKSGVNWRCDVNGNKQKDKLHPVIHVSWNDAVEYCQWLSKKKNVTVRLPTEAEWEYACRAGTLTPFHTGENLTTDQANYHGEYPYKNYPKGKFIGNTTPVGSYPPNAWGLCDMHGNVWEWCQDWWGEDYYEECKKQGIVENPTGPNSGSPRVIRGGCWFSNARYCRSAARADDSPGDRGGNVGFRLVFVP